MKIKLIAIALAFVAVTPTVSTAQNINLHNPSFNKNFFVGSGWYPLNWDNCNHANFQKGVGTFPWNTTNNPVGSHNHYYLRATGKDTLVNGEATYTDSTGITIGAFDQATTAGANYQFTIDVRKAAPGNTQELFVKNVVDPIATFYLGSSNCAHPQKIWQETITNTTSWETKTINFTANGVYDRFFIIINTETFNDGSFGVAYFDNASAFTSSTDINDFEILKSSIYPNPFENSFTVQLSDNTTYPITVEVMDYLGRKVYVQQVETSITKIDLNDLPSSTYFVKVFNETTQLVERIVKTK